MALQEANGASDAAWFVSELRLKGVSTASYKERPDIFLTHRFVIELWIVVGSRLGARESGSSYSRVR